MAKYRITGFPEQEVPKVTLSKVLGPVNRNIANVEAEKGETVVTNMSRGLNNIYEMYSIGGKKHSQGGTPLNLPTDGDKESDGTSFIFSDNKKMIVKDPALLEYFGVNPKKPQTFAGISKSWLDAINTSKQILIDDSADNISRKSAQMSMDNAAFKIAALKLLQESKKGMKDGVPNGLSPFFDKLQIDPNEMFAMNEKDAEVTNQAVAKAFGGAINDFVVSDNQYEFPSLAMGGELPQYNEGGKVKVYKKEDLPASADINTSGKAYKIGQYVPQEDGTYLKVTKVNQKPIATADTQTSKGPIDEWIKASPENAKAAAEADKIIKKGIAAGTIIPGRAASDGSWVKDENSKKINITGAFKPTFEERIKLSRVINQSGDKFRTGTYTGIRQSGSGEYGTRKNGKLEGGSFVAGFTPEDYEKRYLFEKSRGIGMTDDEAFKAVEDTYKDQAKLKEHRKEYVNFLGIPFKDEELMSPDFYKKNYKVVTSSIEKKLGVSGYRPSMGDDALSGFEHFDAFGFIAEPEYEGNQPDVIPGTGPCKKCSDGTTPVRGADGVCLPCNPAAPAYKKMPATNQLINPYGFRREDLASLNRAVQARFQIPELKPWAKSAEVVMPDRTYYSPERSIAAKNEQLKQMMQGVSSFGNAQGAGATAMAISGQAYADVANIISDYADKNVGVFNQGEQYNTQLANARNAADAGLSTNLYDKENTLKQNLANSVSAAKDKITQLSNQAFTNAANIYNLNLNSENFKKDPFTGLISKVNDRAITPTASSSKDFGEEFTAFAESVPTLKPELQMEAFLAIKSGKYKLDKPNADVTTPSDLSQNNYGG